MSIAMLTIGCPSMRQRIQLDASTSGVLLLRIVWSGREGGLLEEHRFERKTGGH